MKNISRGLVFASILLMLYSCSTISVVVDFDRQTDFSKFKTYKWIKQKSSEQSNDLQNDLNRKRFAQAIEKELSGKGFQRVTDVKPDFKVVYHLRFEKRLDISSYGYRYYPGSGVAERYVQTKIYEEGSVIIDIIDASDDQLVWRGSAEGVLNDYIDAEELINNVVKQILKKFPPHN